MISIVSKSTAIKNNIETLKMYLLLKVNEGDWHGVADAAMDLRELEVKLKIYLNQEEMMDLKRELGHSSVIQGGQTGSGPR